MKQESSYNIVCMKQFSFNVGLELLDKTRSLFHGRDVPQQSFPSLLLTVNTNSLRNSLSLAGGISSTFLSPTFLCFCSRFFVFLLIYEIIYYSSNQRKSWHFFYFVLQKAARLLPSTLVMQRQAKMNDKIPTFQCLHDAIVKEK